MVCSVDNEFIGHGLGDIVLEFEARTDVTLYVVESVS